MQLKNLFEIALRVMARSKGAIGGSWGNRSCDSLGASLILYGLALTDD
jgi:hypothetical protein